MTYAQKLVALLREKKLHVCTAESCTGGMVSSAIVDVSGASEVFEEGYITYSDAVKIKNLAVREETIHRYTVVSGETAREMAAGAAGKSGAQLAIATTGYAGPDAAEDGTPAGTVYVGIYCQGQSESTLLQLQGDRNDVRMQAAQEALRLAYLRLAQE